MKRRANINPKCAERLKKFLSKHDITQTELCEVTGISMNTISKICNKKSPLTPYVAGEIVKCFPGTRYEWLMGNDDFETDLMLQGYKALKPHWEKARKEKAVLSFFSSFNLTFSLNTSESSPLMKMTTDEMIDKSITEEWTSKEWETVFDEYETLSCSPTAYVIEKDGEVWGYCSEEEKKALFEEIVDFAEFSLLKLCNREGQTNG